MKISERLLTLSSRISRQNSGEKYAGAALFVGASQFLLCLVISEALVEGYSVSSNYISELGVGATAFIFNISVLALGVAAIIGVCLLRGTFRYGMLPHLLVLCGVGCIGVGCFPYTYGIIHTAFSLLAFLCGALAALTSCRLYHALMKQIFGALGAIPLAALALFATGEVCFRYYSMSLNLMIGLGGMERMIVYPVLIWTIGFGGLLMAGEGR